MFAPTAIPTPHVLDVDIPLSDVVLPAPAWEQAVFVCLFIVLVGLLMYYVFKHFDKIMDSQKSIVEGFQRSMEIRDKLFLQAQEKRDESFEERNGVVLQGLKEVVKGQTDLQEAFIAHDAAFNQALDDMRTAKQRNRRATDVKTQPRANQ